MTERVVAWDRLVRYVAADGARRYGEPILRADGNEDIVTLADQGILHVKVLVGNDPLIARPTNEIELVKELLGPLEAKDIPLIRCIGLNYKSHSMLQPESLPNLSCNILMTTSSSTRRRSRFADLPYNIHQT